MVRLFFKTGRKSIFLLTSEGYWIIKHLYLALYPIKPQTVFKIIWRQIVQFAMRTHEIVEVHTIEIQSGDEAHKPSF